MSLESQLAEVTGYKGGLDPNAMPGEQRSPEWLMERVGKATGSEFSEIMATRKDKKESARRYNYRMELVIERLTGLPSDRYVSKYMEWGTEHEAAARMAYEARSGGIVMQPGFTNHPTVAMCGGSVDGLVDDDGIIEIKCPTTFTHIETFLSGMDDDHKAQTQGYLWITGRQYCDFISFDPRLPHGLQLYVQRIQRDDDYIAELAAHVMRFLAELQEQYDALMAIAKDAPALPRNAVDAELIDQI